jgi:hypothetical protein
MEEDSTGSQGSQRPVVFTGQRPEWKDCVFDAKAHKGL